VTTLLLIRHGRTTANTAGVLAGWTSGVALDETGRDQALALGRRLASVPLQTVVTSPLQRCRETAELLLSPRGSAPADRPPVHTDEDLAEVRYGSWTGRALKDLAKDPLWRVVQEHPAGAAFPGTDGAGHVGESLAAMSARAVAAVRRWNTDLGPNATYAVVSHGDVIKAVVADALGVHLDGFQRIVVHPASLSVIRYTQRRPFVVTLNDVGAVDYLIPLKRRRRRRTNGDAVPGGDAGKVDG